MKLKPGYTQNTNYSLSKIEKILNTSTRLSAKGECLSKEIFLYLKREWEEEIYRAQWKRYMMEKGLSTEEAEEMLTSLDRVHGKLDTLAKFREMLQEAGFERIFCPYWHEMYAVFVAFKFKIA